MVGVGRLTYSWIYFRSLILALLYVPVQSQSPDHTLYDSQKYITRPDIEAPRFETTTYERDLVSPGYWFVESYDYLDQSLVNGGKWTAPHIFDGDGELIWSGAYLSQQYDTFDFRMSNILGEDMLTFLYPRNRTGIVLDTSFNIRKIFATTLSNEESENMHDLHFVDNGTRALFFYDQVRNVSALHSNEPGFTQGNCQVADTSFRELDLTRDWEVAFSWQPSDHVDLSESTAKREYSLEERCGDPKGWDFMHANSLDRFPDDGSYLYSGRHTDAIYKIAQDGSIIWRLGGVKSDFDADFTFLRQHHARIHAHNSTHTIISLFDNAKAEDIAEAITACSRGVIVALRTDVRPMTATLLSEYRHPDGPGAYTLGRGSTQLLPNGNVFSCWVNWCLHSEHTSDGRLIMKAQVNQEWLKSYRSYKFPFVGRPAQPPDVHSATLSTDGDSTMTMVYVSWNGATEVGSWILYKTDNRGNCSTAQPVASLPRTGFETALRYDGYATYVVVEALDRGGQALGRSKVVKTIVSSPLSETTIALEAQWLQNLGAKKQESKESYWSERAKATASNGVTKFALGLICGVTLAVAGRAVWRAMRKGLRWWRPRSQSYEMDDIGAEGEDKALVQDHEEQEHQI